MCWHIPSYPVFYVKCGHTYTREESWEMCHVGEAAGAWCDPITQTSVASSTNRKFKCPDCTKKGKDGSGKKGKDDRDKDEGKGSKSRHHHHRHEVVVGS